MIEGLLVGEAQVRWYAMLLAFGGIACWEALAPQRPVARVGGRWAVALVLLVLGSLLSRAAFPALTVGMAAACASAGIGLFGGLRWPWYVEASLAIVLLDLSCYWEHRLLHRVPWFWRLHRVHHSDPDFDCSTALRFHPLEVPATMAMHGLAIAAIGPTPGTMLAYEVVFLFSAAWAHANVRVPGRLEAALRRVLVTPSLHAIHHSSLPADANRNFSAVSSLWDRLFGSFAAASARPGPLHFGIEGLGGERPGGLGWLLTLPFTDAAPVRARRAGG